MQNSKTETKNEEKSDDLKTNNNALYLQTKLKNQRSNNIKKIIDALTPKNANEYEKILIQMRIFREKGYRQTKLYKKWYENGINILNKTEKNKYKKQLYTFKFMDEMANIYYNDKQYIKCISYCKEGIQHSKGILEHSSMDVLKCKELMGLSYEGLNSLDECINIYNDVLHGIKQHIMTINNNDNKKLKELNIWVGNIMYKIAFGYNGNKRFDKAIIYAENSLKMREVWDKNTENHLLSLMLVSVIISAPKHMVKGNDKKIKDKFEDYKRSMDYLEQCKQIIKLSTNTESTDVIGLTKYNDQIKKLQGKILPACIRYCKLNGINLRTYLKADKDSKTKTVKSKK